MKKAILVFTASLFLSCSPARFVKPLAKNEQAVDVSFGGPLFKMGNNTIPMPFLSATYGYGIDSTLTGFGSLNITSALYGNFQAELGVSKQVLKQHSFVPAITLVPILNIIYRNPTDAKIYPQADLYAWWQYGHHHNFMYAGMSNWFELANTRTLEQPQDNHWIFTPVIGHAFSSQKWNLNIEAKVIAPAISNEKLVIEYQTPFKNSGAFGLYIGYTRKF